MVTGSCALALPETLGGKSAASAAGSGSGASARKKRKRTASNKGGVARGIGHGAGERERGDDPAVNFFLADSGVLVYEHTRTDGYVEYKPLTQLLLRGSIPQADSGKLLLMAYLTNPTKKIERNVYTHSTRLHTCSELVLVSSSLLDAPGATTTTTTSTTSTTTTAAAAAVASGAAPNGGAAPGPLSMHFAVQPETMQLSAVSSVGRLDDEYSPPGTGLAMFPLWRPPRVRHPLHAPKEPLIPLRRLQEERKIRGGFGVQKLDVSDPTVYVALYGLVGTGRRSLCRAYSKEEYEKGNVAYVLVMDGTILDSELPAVEAKLRLASNKGGLVVVEDMPREQFARLQMALPSRGLRVLITTQEYRSIKSNHAHVHNVRVGPLSPEEATSLLSMTAVESLRMSTGAQVADAFGDSDEATRAEIVSIQQDIAAALGNTVLWVWYAGWMWGHLRERTALQRWIRTRNIMANSSSLYGASPERESGGEPEWRTALMVRGGQFQGHVDTLAALVAGVVDNILVKGDLPPWEIIALTDTSKLSVQLLCDFAVLCERELSGEDSSSGEGGGRAGDGEHGAAARMTECLRVLTQEQLIKDEGNGFVSCFHVINRAVFRQRLEQRMPRARFLFLKFLASHYVYDVLDRTTWPQCEALTPHVWAFHKVYTEGDEGLTAAEHHMWRTIMINVVRFMREATYDSQNYYARALQAVELAHAHMLSELGISQSSVGNVSIADLLQHFGLLVADGSVEASIARVGEVFTAETQAVRDRLSSNTSHQLIQYFASVMVKMVGEARGESAESLVELLNTVAARGIDANVREGVQLLGELMAQPFDRHALASRVRGNFSAMVTQLCDAFTVAGGPSAIDFAQSSRHVMQPESSFKHPDVTIPAIAFLNTFHDIAFLVRQEAVLLQGNGLQEERKGISTSMEMLQRTVKMHRTIAPLFSVLDHFAPGPYVRGVHEFTQAVHSLRRCLYSLQAYPEAYQLAREGFMVRRDLVEWSIDNLNFTLLLNMLEMLTEQPESDADAERLCHRLVQFINSIEAFTSIRTYIQDPMMPWADEGDVMDSNSGVAKVMTLLQDKMHHLDVEREATRSADMKASIERLALMVCELGIAAHGLSTCYLRMSLYRIALRYDMAAVAFKHIKLGDHCEIAKSHNTIACCYASQGRYDQAEQHFTEASRILRDDRTISSRSFMCVVNANWQHCMCWMGWRYVSKDVLTTPPITSHSPAGTPSDAGASPMPTNSESSVSSVQTELEFGESVVDEALNQIEVVLRNMRDVMRSRPAEARRHNPDVAALQCTHGLLLLAKANHLTLHEKGVDKVAVEDCRVRARAKFIEALTSAVQIHKALDKLSTTHDNLRLYSHVFITPILNGLGLLELQGGNCDRSIELFFDVHQLMRKQFGSWFVNNKCVMETHTRTLDVLHNLHIARYCSVRRRLKRTIPLLYGNREVMHEFSEAATREEEWMREHILHHLKILRERRSEAANSMYHNVECEDRSINALSDQPDLFTEVTNVSRFLCLQGWWLTQNF